MKNILFDLYGTLIDIKTDESSDYFWQKLAEETNKYLAIDYLALREKYLSICAKLSLVKEEIEILDVFEELFEVGIEEAMFIAKKFRRLSTKYIRLYCGVKSTLRTLKENGVNIYLLSNAQKAFTIFELERFKIIKYFDGIAISSDYGIKKPNKNFFLQAINNFGLKEEIWMIGNDLKCDIFPAMELGLKTIFVKSDLTFETDSNYSGRYLKGFNKKKLLKELGY